MNLMTLKADICNLKIVKKIANSTKKKVDINSASLDKYHDKNYQITA